MYLCFGHPLQSQPSVYVEMQQNLATIKKKNLFYQMQFITSYDTKNEQQYAGYINMPTITCLHT